MLFHAGSMQKMSLPYVYSVEKDHVYRDLHAAKDTVGHCLARGDVPKTRGYPFAEDRIFGRPAADSK